MGGNDIISGLGAYVNGPVSALDYIYGGEGDDTLFGASESGGGQGGADNIYGENGNDLITGSDRADNLQGGSGNDSITDGTENDVALDKIYGGDGDDEIVAASLPAHQDKIECGTGTDIAVVDKLDAVASDCETVNKLLSAEESLARDAKQYAVDNGVPIAEATQRLELQDDVGELRETLETNESDTFADLYITHGEEYKVIALFTQDGNQTIQPYIDGTSLEGEVETRPVEATLTELEAAQDQATSMYESQDTTVESDINVQENQAEIYVTEEGQTQFAAAQRSRQAQSLDHVEVITVDRLSTPVADFYGGLSINKCTSGFSIRMNGGAEGMITAGHCKDNQYYLYGRPFSFELQKFSGSHDVQLHGTPQDDRAWFWDRTGSVRGVYSVKGRKRQSVGDYVCKSGRTTGYTCGTVGSRYYRPGYVPSPNYTFIRVKPSSSSGNLVAGGDSGGPVFNGSTALGLVSGESGPYEGHMLYMGLNYALDAGFGISHIQEAG